MKTIITSFFLLIAITFAQAQTETRPLGSFQGIDVSGSISVDIIKSSESKAEITILKGSIDQLITEVSGNVLKVKFANADGSSWGSGAKAKVVLYTKSINQVDASAGAAVESGESWESKSLDLQASSGARIALSAKSNQCSAEASSGAKVTVRGSTNKLSAASSSGASVNASELVANSADAMASSGGSTTVNATEKIKASATAGGSVKYKGNPTQEDIEKDKYSGGMISKM